MTIEKFTIGMGDRFGHQGNAQLESVARANAAGIPVFPTWNKSNREHTIIGTEPSSLRAEADAAVAALGWKGAYYVDADHIGLATVDRFLEASNFFTLDVADYTGKAAEAQALDAFVEKHKGWATRVEIAGLSEPLCLNADALRAVAAKFLLAIQKAGSIYRHVEKAKGAGNFVTEVSIDETDSPQTPAELLLILAMISDEGIPAQTVAPKFTGRFNKGVDYVGDIAKFEKEFEEDILVIAHAVSAFGLPSSLKLSVHSGSDKFSLYPVINRLVKKHGCGLHVKTAGTTWLEEVIGLAEAGGEGLAIAKEIYAGALPHFDELVGPYAAVVDISPARLPEASTVAGWTGEEFAAALRHDQTCAAYNADFRQFIHVSFKVAAKLGARYTDALKANSAIIARNVTGNLLDRHIHPVFG